LEGPKKKKSLKRKPAPESKESEIASRRSLRLQSVPAEKCDENTAAWIDGQGLEDVKPRKKRRRTAPKRERPPPPHDSCRVMDVDIKALREKYLGKPCGRLKREVMGICCGELSRHIRFSKYSGIAEWKNATVLFVNIYGDSYKNVFLHKGEQITWFAQARQTEETPMIAKLIPTEGGSEGSEIPVLLFCRPEKKDYIYCGALKYLGHDPSMAPLRFVWKLQDFKDLTKMFVSKTEEEGGVSEGFAALVQESERLVKELYE